MARAGGGSPGWPSGRECRRRLVRGALADRRQAPGTVRRADGRDGRVGLATGRGGRVRSRRRWLAVMLEEVRINGLGVIDDALLELSPGFTPLTGAGKTMVVTGLGLLFGGRGDPARVRPGAQRASVEGRLRTDPRGKVAQQVEEAGGDLDDDGTLVLTRTVSGEGRSRAFAGGRSVPVSLLTYLADDLVAVHGQSDQQQLLKPGRQRESLDKYAGGVLAEVLTDYQRAYGRHRKVLDELTELTTQTRARASEAEQLRTGLAEVEKLNPVAGEEAALRADEDRLANADSLHAAATGACSES